ncbi:hypothetical protein IAR55_003222 [Kwoniella newhampshirensis]|uniref:FAD-binding domain-containing protein n=1 Tax=Kwoniella newhampshirensis TaxID=1651941 RepID=A0AAW0YR79_9TREE
MPPPSHVLIVGGGLCGPALAIALSRHRIRSTILELRPQAGNNGGAIMLAPNALRVLDKVIGVDEEIKGEGFGLDKIDFFWEDGLRVGGITMEDGGYGALRIQRTKLHRTLLDLCERDDRVEIKYGSKFVRIVEDEEGVTAYIEGGEAIRGDILIGADGIHSKVRAHVLGDRAPVPTYSGMVGIGGTLPRSSIILPEGMTYPSFIYTPRGMIMVMPTDPEGQAIGWAASLADPHERSRKGWLEYQNSGQAARDIKESYAGIRHEPIRSIMDNMVEEEQARVWAPYEIPDLSTWHTKRVCLIGDAAHAIPPSGGQGAGQAFEDAGFMARLLSAAPPSSSSPPASSTTTLPEQATATTEPKSYDELFAHFEKVRKARFEHVRELTKVSGNSRHGSPTWTGTMVRKYGMWAYFHLVKGGYYTDHALMGYDVMDESVEY